MRIVSRKPSESATQRLGRLAKLPVFLDLTGKHALVAGGSAAAAWKAELLAAAGAHVHIYAPQLATEMQSLLDNGAAGGALIHHTSGWTEGSFDGAAIAIADAEDECEAQLFLEAANARGVICNVIDRPCYSTIQFGAIVNRSPVVIGISTDGAAPMLGQAIRSRIETLLPAALAEWAALAQAIRARVKYRLPAGLRRRRFWECFSALAFGPAPDGLAQKSADAMIDSIAGDSAAGGGRITIVDVDARDADLLTLRALRAMQAADVILFDEFVSGQVLELARREARRMLVRRCKGRDNLPMEEIGDLAMKFARSGKHAVLLRSDHLAIAGKPDTEITRYAREGIAVETIPVLARVAANTPAQPVLTRPTAATAQPA